MDWNFVQLGFHKENGKTKTKPKTCPAKPSRPTELWAIVLNCSWATECYGGLLHCDGRWEHPTLLLPKRSTPATLAFLPLDHTKLVLPQSLQCSHHEELPFPPALGTAGSSSFRSVMDWMFVPPPPPHHQFICWSPNSQCDSIRKWAFWGQLHLDGHEGRALVMRLVPL